MEVGDFKLPAELLLGGDLRSLFRAEACRSWMVGLGDLDFLPFLAVAVLRSRLEPSSEDSSDDESWLRDELVSDRICELLLLELLTSAIVG